MSSVVLPARVRAERCKVKFWSPEGRRSGAAKAAAMIAVREVDSNAFLATRAFQASSVPRTAKPLGPRLFDEQGRRIFYSARWRSNHVPPAGEERWIAASNLPTGICKLIDDLLRFRAYHALNQSHACSLFERQLSALFTEALNEQRSVGCIVGGHQYASPASVDLNNLELVAPVAGGAVFDRTSSS